MGYPSYNTPSFYAFVLATIFTCSLSSTYLLHKQAAVHFYFNALTLIAANAFSDTHPDSLSSLSRTHNQCDQIGQNFATSVKKLNVFVYFLRVYFVIYTMFNLRWQFLCFGAYFRCFIVQI